MSEFIKKKHINRNRRGFIIVMLILPVTWWVVFWLFVNLNSFLLAFRTARTAEWTLNNFVELWDQLTRANSGILLSLKNTLIYFFVCNILLLVANLVVAYFMYKRVVGYKAFRIIFYLPAIISSVAMTTVFQQFILPGGPLYKIMEVFHVHLPPEGLLKLSGTATGTVLVYCIWTGFTSNVLMFTGALSRIPIEIFESAKLEGCGAWRELTKLVVPLIWPMFSTLLIFALTGLFGAGGPILLLTNGDADTSTLSFWIFKQVYGDGQHGGTGSYGLVSAAGLFFTAVGVPIILFVRWLVEKVPSTEY